MVISNSSSSSITSSTISRESAPISSVNEVERVTCSLFTPRFSQTISMTRSSTEGTIESSQPDADRSAHGGEGQVPTMPLPSGYLPQAPPVGQDDLLAAQGRDNYRGTPHTSKKGKIR